MKGGCCGLRKRNPHTTFGDGLNRNKNSTIIKTNITSSSTGTSYCTSTHPHGSRNKFYWFSSSADGLVSRTGGLLVLLWVLVRGPKLKANTC